MGTRLGHFNTKTKINYSYILQRPLLRVSITGLHGLIFLLF